MKEFDFQEKKNILTVKICGKEYSFNVSPTNYKFIKTVAGLWHEVEAMTKKLADMKHLPMGDLEAQFDAIKEKEQQMVEAILPGSWDELFEKAGYDLLSMVDLLTFVAGEIKSAGVAAKVESVKPATKGKREI